MTFDRKIIAATRHRTAYLEAGQRTAIDDLHTGLG